MPLNSRTNVNIISSMEPMSFSAREDLPVVGNANSPERVPTNSTAGQSLPVKKHRLYGLKLTPSLELPVQIHPSIVL